MTVISSKRLIVLCLGSAIAGAVIGHVLPLPGLSTKEGQSLLPSTPPPYLEQLATQGYGVKAIPSSELAKDGWRVWSIERHGDDVLAMASRDSDVMAIGGELYSADGRRISDLLRAEHHRQHLTFASISQQSRWVDLPSDKTDQPAVNDESAYQAPLPTMASNAPEVIWFADPTDASVQDAYAAYMSGRSASAVRFIPYPEAESYHAMNGVLAILEADYRTPVGQPEIITQQRGGDLGFTHTSASVLSDLLDKRVIPAPKATDGHPAEQEAFQGVSQNLYLMERLGIEEPHVFHPDDNAEQGNALAMTPLSEWIDTYSH